MTRCVSYLLDESEEGLLSSCFYGSRVQTGIVKSSGLLHGWTSSFVLWLWQKDKTNHTVTACVAGWRSTATVQTLTQNLPEILQQHSLPVQSRLLSHSFVFSLSTLSRALRPPILVLWMSRDALSSLSPPTVSWESACEQEVVTWLLEGVGRGGQTGRGPLTGWGQTWSH